MSRFAFVEPARRLKRQPGGKVDSCGLAGGSSDPGLCCPGEALSWGVTRKKTEGAGARRGPTLSGPPS